MYLLLSSDIYEVTLERILERITTYTGKVSPGTLITHELYTVLQNFLLYWY
jgi:hypothetical protein